MLDPPSKTLSLSCLLCSRCLKESREPIFNITSNTLNFLEASKFRNCVMSFLVPRRSASFLDSTSVATSVVHVGGRPDGAAASQNPSPWIQMLSTVLAPFLLPLLFLFLFFGSAHAAVPARGCWLSRSTEVASNRIPAQQAIVRSKEIALQKYTESAACKKSKKACLRGVCVDRSRLHFTVTDGRRTRRRRTRGRSLRWRKRGWRRLSPVDPRCIEIQREETYPP